MNISSVIDPYVIELDDIDAPQDKSAEVRGLLQMRRFVTPYIFDSDPGSDVLLAGARRTITKAICTERVWMHIF